mmetsp:Transcript_100685/g.162367  ORF Transcript_100685/g.162367 Transcript_100685/m.162367 type:complete len:203 (+) Transcript_100685:630-1238(+)
MFLPETLGHTVPRRALLSIARHGIRGVFDFAHTLRVLWIFWVLRVTVHDRVVPRASAREGWEHIFDVRFDARHFLNNVVSRQVTLVFGKPQRLRLGGFCKELKLATVGVPADEIRVLSTHVRGNVVHIVEPLEVCETVDAKTLEREYVLAPHFFHAVRLEFRGRVATLLAHPLEKFLLRPAVPAIQPVRLLLRRCQAVTSSQ